MHGEAPLSHPERPAGSLAALTARAEQVLGSREKAREFMTSAHPLLGGRTPQELAGTEEGARRVEALLGDSSTAFPCEASSTKD
jgi:uncharacterized protein (DUF2384 family)